ncbi:DUF1236 domain-containing protein [Paracoccus sediminicola]|uniref:DUF1236 domain-containing protein n=1 Tax=Paracoccus sediminicola TaxID=3017783 RepID=UPI0022F07CDB|nr:DUF1236 domain-containing protein [Paracoccus sediminicola]WBU57170.1 DUF1236 domain-containing protein [Paracoccus sediminicola]
MYKIFAATTAASLVFAGTAFAQTAATAGTDLNLRAGPGVQHEVTGVITGGDEVSVVGCIESANWCEVNYGDQNGWAYGDYLAAKVGEEFKPIYPNRQEIGVTIIESEEIDPEEQGQNAAVGAGTGAAMGALIAGPLGAIVGATAGTAAGAAATEPEETVTTYVEENPQEPVMLEGEVVVGAGIPEEVTLYDIPENEQYQYVTINGQRVLVNPDDRKIVYVYR